METVYRLIKMHSIPEEMNLPCPAAAYIHLQRHLLQVQLILSFHPQLLEVLTKCFLPSLRPNAGR